MSCLTDWIAGDLEPKATAGSKRIYETSASEKPGGGWGFRVKCSGFRV